MSQSGGHGGFDSFGVVVAPCQLPVQVGTGHDGFKKFAGAAACFADNEGSFFQLGGADAFFLRPGMLGCADKHHLVFLEVLRYQPGRLYFSFDYAQIQTVF